MELFRKFLFVVMVLELVFLFTQKEWMPKLVSHVLGTETRSFFNSSKNDNLSILSPQNYEIVSFPLYVRGSVKGSPWTAFEGVAGNVQLFNSADQAISEIRPLSATTEWTQLPVSFEATLEDKRTVKERRGEVGYLLFKSESPRGDKYVNEFALPVIFD